MKKQLLITALAFISWGMFSQVTVTGGSTATYSNVNAAFAAINAGTHTGAITIDISASTTEPSTPTPLIASGQGSANYTSVIIRPTAVVSVSGAGVTGRGVLEFDGADNVTINGDIVGGPVNRDLTIENLAGPTIANTAAIRLIGKNTGGMNVANFTLINCKVAGSTPGNDGSSGSTLTSTYAFYAGTSLATITTGSYGYDYDNMLIDNNEFTRAYYGLYIGGVTGFEANNNTISNNLFGSSITSEKLTYRGIEVRGVISNTITQNEVFELKASTSINNAGISVETTSSNNVIIERNKVHGIWSTSTGGWGAYGINLVGGNNHIVMNNVIYDIMTTNYNSTSTTYQAYGIRITTGTGHKIYYNSVHLFGTLTGGSTTNCYSSAFLVTSTAVTGLDIQNNIFSNKQSSTVTTPRFFAMYFPASYNFLNANINNNAYMVTNDADHYTGRIGTVDYSNLSAWTAMSQVNNPTNDNASVPPVNGNAPFISDNNLNFNVNTVTPIESGAATTTLTNIDIDGFTRPKSGTNPNTQPDMGAYEFDGLAGVATDAGISALASPLTYGCYGAAENLEVIIKNYGTASISNIPVTVIVSGAASQTSTATYAGPLAAGATANFTVATLNMLTAGTYSFFAYTSLAGDLNNPNDTLATTTRTVIAPSPLPQQVDFTGFSGANLPTFFPLWTEATGTAVPTGTTSAWTSQTGLNGVGNITARVYLYGNIRNEWLVGPKFTATSTSQITFDAALTASGSTVNPSTMGSDDQVRVMVSTDCGVSYTPIFTVSATNSLTTTFTNFVVPLGAYAGQNIIVAFLAQDGPIDDIETMDFHLDNINLYNAVPQDAGVTALVKPSTTGCYGSAEDVEITINNYGSLAITNFPVTVIVSGAVTQTINATYTASIPPSTSASFTVGTLNMTTAGVYNFMGYTSLTGDGNNANDTMAVATRTVVGPSTLPTSVDFTGFTGANLPTPFPLWYEANTASVPTGTTSSWLSQTNLNGAGNITARVNLYGTIRNEWIVGPKFTATSNSQISFDAAITAASSVNTYSAMGSDDQVRVMVSTDCGVSYTPIFTVSATNSLTTLFTNFTVPLGVYAGQDIIVAFLAQDGPTDDLESYDFHLDNINLYNASATDAGVAAIITPSTTGCYSNNEPVSVTIKNYGAASISNVPVSVYISGANSQTITGTYTGSIPVGGTATFTVGSANMSFGGAYTFTSTTALAGDLNTFNDITISNYTVNPIMSILGKTVLCLGDTAILTAGGTATTFTWSTGANTSSISVAPSTTTSYTLVGNDGTCSARVITTITVNNPTITATGAAICTGNTATLSANAFAPINWYASPTATTALAGGNTFTATAVTTTTYYAEAVSSAVGTLSTTLAGGNGSSGNMFDIVAVGSIEINGFDVHLNGTATTNIEVWYRPGTYVGNEASNVGWTNILNTTVVGMGTGNLTNVPATFTVSIPAGQTYAFYVRPSGGSGFNYTNGTVAGNVFVQNSDLQVLEGNGIANFGSGPFTPRVFNGNVRYTKVGCTSPRIPVTLTVTPAPTLTVNTTNTVLCAGSSATLSAFGASTYSWSTGQTTQGIVVTPTTTTSYTVTGTTGGCSTDSVITQVVATCTGIDNILANNSGVIIYPNPSKDVFNVIVADIHPTTKIEVLDALGRVIITNKILTKSSMIDANELSSGVYVYRIVDSNGIVKQGKLVKE